MKQENNSIYKSKDIELPKKLGKKIQCEYLYDMIIENPSKKKRRRV